jgi:hypothetical protein
MGDFIYACAGIKQLCQKAKADIYMELDVSIKFLDGIRPCLTRPVYEMAKPLIEAQPWCNSVQEYINQHIDVDLDKTQLDPSVSLPVMPYGSITHWYQFLFPLMSGDFSKPWIEVPQHVYNYTIQDKIVVNRTARYRNDNIDYKILKPYEDKILFVGLPDEYTRFIQETGVMAQYWQVFNFIELARVLQQCRVFIGNQSMCFALAEAMKTKRILEVCLYAPNVIPEGPNGEDFVYQFAFEHYVNQAMK